MKKNEHSLPPNVGKTIQRLRQAYNLSLGDLAEQSGVSKSIISQIERNESNPTLATIWRLSNALETSIENVLQNKDLSITCEKLSNNATPVIKSEDGLCELRVLSPIQTVEWVQWYTFLAKPDGVLESDGHQIGSTEHLTITKGEVTVTAQNKSFLLKEGETLRYPADSIHIIKNTGSTEAVALMTLILKSSVIT